ncbi:hypothetical protein O1611_g3912 [Lasiodiplodia mahajangana]|uniref:Uncharacterized protein n=1 Tax=Lasiodiplodia mahajangana TaxID=1108764 RepID=A0ACC2JR24_9PEZI|nr:hypothetical protein O1611_g3912 [Lasiodiplodia mahajangana]
MPLKLTLAVPADAARIADIHMAAFATNGMLLAQFPTPEIREGLREAIKKKALADIHDSKITVLVVRDTPPGRDTATPEDSDNHHSAAEGALNRCNTEENITGKVIAFAKWSHPVGKGEKYEETPWEWPPGTEMRVLENWTRETDEAQEAAIGDEPCYRLSFMGTDPRYERRGAASMMFYKKMGFKAAKDISLEFLLNGQNQKYDEIAFVYRSGSA